MSKRYVNDFVEYKGRHNKFDIIGDIHGCYSEFMELIHKLGYVKVGNCYKHPKGRILVSVGDIGDKGPQNLKSFRFWMNQVSFGDGLWVYGNHCNKLFRYFLGNKVKLTHGLQNTIGEWNKLNGSEREKFKIRYMNIYKKLTFYLILDEGKLIVVHGGIKKEYIGEFDGKIKTMCLYGDTTGEFDENGRPIRLDWAAEYKGDPFIVYGHTVMEEAIIRNNTIDIDQGCVYGGKLTCFRYPEMKIVQVKGKKYCER